MTSRTRQLAPVVLLVLGGLGLAFGQGHWSSGAALLAGVALTARFFHGMRARAAVPLFVVAHVLVWEWAYAGMVPLPTFARIGLEAGTSILLSVVFVADAWTRRHQASFATTLVLPCGWVAFDLASARLSPGGTWGSIAYTFADDSAPTIVIAQVASLAGWTGLTFLVAWTASALNWAWDHRRDGARSNRGLAAVGATIAVVLVFGAVRTQTGGDGDLIRVACVVPPNSFVDESLDDLWAYTRGVDRPVPSTERAIARIHASLDEHFDFVERAAAEGVQLVVWPEANPVLTDAEEPALIERASATAIANGIHLGMGMSIFRPASSAPTLNRFVLVDPDGRVAIDFLKATRPPGAGHVKGDGVLPALDTPLGRLSTAICFDLDFPHLIGQAGAADVHVFLAPSNDWRAVRDTHARMARLRAIEQGFALVRPTKDGVTLITDAVGRDVATLALDDNRTGLVVADLDAGRRWTVYATVGDAFGWGCVITFTLLCGIAARSKRETP